MKTIRVSKVHGHGFTLIEVMISMALVLGLILGINAVFKMAADTVGTGQALSSKMRDERAAQSVFFNDVSHAVTAPDKLPFLVIDSRTQAAFRDSRDKDNDRDYNSAGTPQQQDQQVRSIDIDGNNTEGEPNVPGENICCAAVNDRAHRVDTFSFCARDLYRRQTGNYGTYVADMASSEAWITYGHGRIFDQDYSSTANIDNANFYTDPGYPIFPSPVNAANPLNPKNFYASDWVLLRQVMLLSPPSPATGSPPGTFPTIISDHPGGTSQAFWMRQNAANALPLLQPLGQQTPVQDPTNNTPNTTVITDARYDLAGTTIDEFRSILSDYIEHTNYFTGASKLAATSPVSVDDWWDVLASGVRFRCNPYPQKPIDSRKAAQMSPILLANCSQFIVEFAGDYLTQINDPTNPNYGDIDTTQPPGPDGTIDFFIEQVQTPSGTVPVRRTRWYGFPRDANGDGQIIGIAKNATPVAKKHHELVDVVPLRDVIISAYPNYYNAGLATSPANKAAFALVRFERGVFNDGPNFVDSIPRKANYLDMTTPNGAGATCVQPNNRYVAAWSPNESTVTTATGTWSLLPKMIRIIVRTDDPGGKLADGHTSEFVIKLP